MKTKLEHRRNILHTFDKNGSRTITASTSGGSNPISFLASLVAVSPSSLSPYFAFPPSNKISPATKYTHSSQWPIIKNSILKSSHSFVIDIDNQKLSHFYQNFKSLIFHILLHIFPSIFYYNYNKLKFKRENLKKSW